MKVNNFVLGTALFSRLALRITVCENIRTCCSRFIFTTSEHIILLDFLPTNLEKHENNWEPLQSESDVRPGRYLWCQSDHCATWRVTCHTILRTWSYARLSWTRPRNTRMVTHNDWPIVSCCGLQCFRPNHLAINRLTSERMYVPQWPTARLREETENGTEWCITDLSSGY